MSRPRLSSELDLDDSYGGFICTPVQMEHHQMIISGQNKMVSCLFISNAKYSLKDDKQWAFLGKYLEASLVYVRYDSDLQWIWRF